MVSVVQHCVPRRVVVFGTIDLNLCDSLCVPPKLNGGGASGSRGGRGRARGWSSFNFVRTCLMIHRLGIGMDGFVIHRTYVIEPGLPNKRYLLGPGG